MTKVSREDLERAFKDIEPEETEEVIEVKEEEISEEVVEEPEVEETEELEVAPEEELSQPEKSKLGRKLADERREREKLEENLRVTSEKLAKMEGLIEGMSRPGPETAPPEELDPDEPITRAEAMNEYRRLEALRLAKEQEETSKIVAYSEEYTKLAYEKLEDSEHKDEIIKLFRSTDGKYDVKYSDDPAKDLEINLAKAEREVLKAKNKELNKKLEGKNSKLREEDTDGAGGGGGTPEVREASAAKGKPTGMAATYLEHIAKKDPEAAKKLRDRNY